MDDYMMDLFLFKEPKEHPLDKIISDNIGEMAEFYLDSEDSFNIWLNEPEEW